MKYKISLLLSIIIFTTSSFAQIINLTTGVSGSITGVPQSFNENRAVDVTVLSTHNIHLTSMSVHGYWVGGDGTANLSARIYNSTTHALLFSHDTTVYNINNGTVNVPVSYILDTGVTYRISFYSSGPNSDNAGYMFQPSSLPYLDSTTLLRINHAYDVGADTFPNNTNIFVPLITMTYDTTSIMTGIQDVGLSVCDIKVYPNPNDGNFTLTCNLLNSQFLIFDLSGRKVYSQAIINQQSSIINVSNLSNGIYYWEIIGEKGIEGKGKIAVIKN